MALTRRELYKKLGDPVREVPIPPDRKAELRRVVRLGSTFNDRVSELIAILMEEATRAEEDAWDEVARLAGFPDADSAHEQGLTFSLDWSRNVIKLHRCPDDEE